MPDAIRFENVTKRYSATTAVDGVDLAIPESEFVTLLGPSGSGKTTLLNMIAGFVEPDEGDVRLHGRSVVTIPPWKRDVGIVFQQYALFPHMTVGRNIAFPLRRRRWSRSAIAERVEECLRLVRLEGLADRYPDQLSGGQAQRVAVARSVAFEPRVLLMDEPLGALDKNLREELQFEIKRIHHETGISIVYVTHDQEEALAMSDAIAVVDGGRIQQYGPGGELYHQPSNLFVANFMGESNVLHGRLEHREGRVELEVASERIPVSGAGLGATEASLVIRPEVVRCFQHPPPDPSVVTLRGRVTDMVDLGSERRLIVELDMGIPLTVRAPAHREEFVPERVERVYVGWQVNDAVLFPAPNASAGTGDDPGGRTSTTDSAPST